MHVAAAGAVASRFKHSGLGIAEEERDTVYVVEHAQSQRSTFALGFHAAVGVLSWLYPTLCQLLPISS
jgi:hypothetical protein